MGAIRLGRMPLRWCDRCDLPLVEDGPCGICGQRGRQVEMTPPGDPRPAFREDLTRIRGVIDAQFGQGSGSALLPEGRIVLLNKVPALDRMDEVLVGGEVIGALRYDLDGTWRFVTRMRAASALQVMATRGTVEADKGAVGPVIEGKNLLVPGVVRATEGIEPGDEVLVLDPEGRAIATGTARMSSSEMASIDRGVAVKTRWTGEPSSPSSSPRSCTWEEVVRANHQIMEAKVEEAVGFMLRTMESHPLPAVVSFSGGKDSLACSLLSMDAGLHLPLLFIDTTLEFPETVEYVRRYASTYGLRLITGSASSHIFMDSVERFGPPGRDFRWCCKTNKLAPTVRTITHHFPQGVLSFIGQRRYESENRSEKPRVWTNPWVPGQVGAAPIQNWTSMQVWVYIFSKGAEYNPWYERGMDRIGCYLCPASDLGEQGLVEPRSEGFRRWKEALHRIAISHGLSQDWVDYALWRWRSPPRSLREELDRLGISSQGYTGREVVQLDLDRPMEYPGGVMVRGRFANPPEGLVNLLCTLDEVREVEGGHTLKGIHLKGGEVTLESEDLKGLRRSVEVLKRVATKAEGCVGCGLCVTRCERGALGLRDGKVWIAEELCTHCGKCIEPCLALTFGESWPGL